jgi:hypothetical protein
MSPWKKGLPLHLAPTRLLSWNRYFNFRDVLV